MPTQRSRAFYMEWSLHLLFWFLFLSALNVNWRLNWFDGSLRLNNPGPLSILAFALFFYWNAFGLIPRFLNHKPRYRYFILVPIIMIGAEVLRIFVFYWANQPGVAFSKYFQSEIIGRESFLFGPVNPIPAALFLSFAYRFTKDWFVNQRRIERLETDKIRTELEQLKAQINPHFLFNNLNTLDGLIEQDPQLAQTYLHKMAALYRYVLTSSEQELVSLKKELDFARQYIFLLENRFGGAYQFEINLEISSVDHYLIPPTSLQTLIENVVKHNLGTPEEPLLSTIRIQEDWLEVRQPKRPKFQVNTQLGTGLQNLKTRYQLIADLDILIQDEPTTFTVRLPLIRQTS